MYTSLQSKFFVVFEGYVVKLSEVHNKDFHFWFYFIHLKVFYLLLLISNVTLLYLSLSSSIY